MSTPRAVIFDMDGLMFDTEVVYTMVGTELLRRRGRVFCNGLKHKMMGLQPRPAFEQMIRWHQLDDDWQVLAEESAGIFLSLLDKHLVAMPGLFDLLDTIEAAGLPKAIATSSPLKLVTPCLDRYNLRPRFEFLLTAEDISQSKPDPEIYLTAARRMQLAPVDTAVLEDSEAGCRAADSAGTLVIAVPGEHSRGLDFSMASLVAFGLNDPQVYEVLGLPN